MVNSFLFVSVGLESRVVILFVPEMRPDVVCGRPCLHVDYFPHFVRGLVETTLAAWNFWYDVRQSGGRRGRPRVLRVRPQP